MTHALQIQSDGPRAWRWRLETFDRDTVRTHALAECAFDTYADAMNAGTLALSRADGQPYENEAADPVGDADC